MLQAVHPAASCLASTSSRSFRAQSRRASDACHHAVACSPARSVRTLTTDHAMATSTFDDVLRSDPPLASPRHMTTDAWNRSRHQGISISAADGSSGTSPARPLLLSGSDLDRLRALASLRSSPAYHARYRTLQPGREESSPPRGNEATEPVFSSRVFPPSVASPLSAPSSRAARSMVTSSKANESSSSSTGPGGSDEDWAFGGGGTSVSGPGPNPVDRSKLRRRLPENYQSSVIYGSAGKGAVMGYGKKNKEMLPTSREADEGIASRYKHSYAPSTRTAEPLPQHTYTTPNAFAPGTTASAQRGGSSELKRKKTALISPGQGSQYVAMARDLYRTYRSARTIWHKAEEALMQGPYRPGHTPGPEERALTPSQREAFEAELAKSLHLDGKRGFAASGTAVARRRRGWLRDLVFSGDQLELTRAENAQPAILTCTLSFLNVLRKEFDVDLVAEHIDWAAGHGSGTYASLVASGALGLSDAVRLLRHRGLISSAYIESNPILFPPGCTPPRSIYETWAFANAGSGKGAELVAAGGAMESGGVPNTNMRTDSDVVAIESARQLEGGNIDAATTATRARGWKRTQMSGIIIKPGTLDRVLKEVAYVADEIRKGEASGVATDEVVEVANINSNVQLVLSGTRVGVSHASDRLKMLGLGARAVNLPVSGPYHTRLMSEAAEVLKPAITHLPVRNPDALPGGFGLISSVDGSVLHDAQDIQRDLSGALAKPVHWLDSIDTLLAQGVERFICLGPGRACAHLLSKELALRDQARAQRGELEGKELEVWSVATQEDVEQLGTVLSGISKREGAVRPSQVFTDAIMAL